MGQEPPAGWVAQDCLLWSVPNKQSQVTKLCLYLLWELRARESVRKYLETVSFCSNERSNLFSCLEHTNGIRLRANVVSTT